MDSPPAPFGRSVSNPADHPFPQCTESRSKHERNKQTRTRFSDVPSSPRRTDLEERTRNRPLTGSIQPDLVNFGFAHARGRCGLDVHRVCRIFTPSRSSTFQVPLAFKPARGRCGLGIPYTRTFPAPPGPVKTLSPLAGEGCGFVFPREKGPVRTETPPTPATVPAAVFRRCGSVPGRIVPQTPAMLPSIKSNSDEGQAE